DEIGAQRRTGLEIWPIGLPQRRLIAVVTCRRRCKRRRERVVECQSGPGEGTQHPAACGMKRHDGLLACEPAPFAILPAVARQRISRGRQRGVHPLDCAPLTRCSMSSTARVASASFCASRARSTTLVLGPCCGSKNG